MNPTSALIRAATIEDCTAIGRLHVAGWHETYRGLMPDSVLDSLSAHNRAEQWRQGLSRGAKGPIVFVAETPDRSLAGFGAAGPARDATRGWQAEIYSLYVLRAHHQRGIGRALMRALASALQARDRSSVGLWVLTANAPARAFYERLGGRVEEQRIDESEGWRCDETAYHWDSLWDSLSRGLL